MTEGPLHIDGDGPSLSQRQAAVLRAMVSAYVGEAAPIGSETLAHLLPVPLSSASIRTTLSELSRMGLVEKPHRSSGRVPTERGLRLFVDQLLDPNHLGSYEMRAIEHSFEDAAAADGVMSVASQLLSERTNQLGFVLRPRLDRVVLRHVTLVQLSTERLLAILVSKTGATYRRVLEVARGIEQAELDRISAMLNERIVGRTLSEVREALADEARALRHHANRLLARALQLGLQALSDDQPEGGDLVIETRLALFAQPEFRDPRRVRDLFAALETKERLLEVLDEMLEQDGVRVAFGEELDEPSLRDCAVIATRYGASHGPLGVLGVIGPSRMDYGRIIPLVDYLSEVITGKLSA